MYKSFVIRDDNISLDVEATNKKIALLIDQSGITDKELSQKLHLSVQAINKWRHKHSLPDIQNIFSLARILNVKIDEMLVPKGVGEIFLEVDSFDKQAFCRRMMAYINKLSKDSVAGEIGIDNLD